MELATHQNSFPQLSSKHNFDLLIVGGGVFGLALGTTVLTQHPTSSVCILERGLLPAGASSKNAGMGTFICFTEFLDDLRERGLNRAIQSVKDSLRGLLMLFSAIEYDPKLIRLTGGYDVILEKDLSLLKYIDFVNSELFDILNDKIFELKNEKIEYFGFDPKIVKALVFRKYDWQLNTGKILLRLMRKFQALGGTYLTGAEVLSFSSPDLPSAENPRIADTGDIKVFVKGINFKEKGVIFEGKHLVFCINSFGSRLIKKSTVLPAREQVMLTKPISNLPLDANFLLELSYYYFRQVGQRLLFGGGRHLDLKAEETFEMKTTEFFRSHLIEKVRELFPGLEFEPDYFWSGIIGLEKKHKNYRIDKIGHNTYNMFGCNGAGMTLCFFTSEKMCGIIFGETAKL